MAINRTTVSKKQTVDKLGKPAKNAYNYRFSELEKLFNSYLEGVRPGRTEKHHRIVLKYLEPYLAKLSKKQALAVMKKVAQKTGFAYGDAAGNLVNLSRELHTKDINAVHNLLQRYTSLQGVKQRSEFLEESLEKITWRGQEVEVGNLVLHDGAGNYGIDPYRRIVGGQSDASIEFIDFFSKQKDVELQADLLVGLLDDSRPAFDGAIASAVYLSDNPKITLEHKKRVLRQLEPKAQVWMEDFIGNIEKDSARTLLEASQRLDAHQLDKNYYKGREVTRANDLATLAQQEKLVDLVEGYKNRKAIEGLPYKEVTAAADAQKYVSKINRQLGGAGLKQLGLAIPVLSPLVSGFFTAGQAMETWRDPSAENKARLSLNVAETGGELVSAAGWLTANPVLVAGGEAVATPAGLTDLGWSAKDAELHKAKTWRQLGVGAKDWFMEKVTDDKGISKLWHEEEEKEESHALDLVW